jgi:hypothetical protein
MSALSASTEWPFFFIKPPRFLKLWRFFFGPLTETSKVSKTLAEFGFNPNDCDFNIDFFTYNGIIKIELSLG